LVRLASFCAPQAGLPQLTDQGRAVLMALIRTTEQGVLTLQLLFLKASESMGNHDSEIVDAGSVD